MRVYNRLMVGLLLNFALSVTMNTAFAEAEVQVPMYDKGMSTFYVEGTIAGFGKAEFMVDTGASYLALNQGIINSLKLQGRATYLKQLKGVMADGRRRSIALYRISDIVIGANCELHDVEAALLPGESRNILGLSVLRKTAPFTFQMDPPSLVLNNCLVPPEALTGL